MFSIPLLSPVLYGIGFRSVLPPVTQTYKAHEKSGRGSQYDNPDTDIVETVDH